MPAQPLFDADEIQGHILPGYPPDTDVVLLAVRAVDKAALQSVLRTLAGTALEHLTTMRAASAHRMLRKLHLAKEGPEPPDPLRLNLALTRDGLDRIGVTERGVDAAFDAGMTGASTGDPKSKTRSDGSQEPAHPSNWLVGGKAHPFDLLIIFGCKQDIRGRTAALTEQVRTSPGIVIVHQDIGENLPMGKEHFGFVDGISVPGVYGVYRENGREFDVTTRYGVPSVDGLEFGKPGQPLVWPGRFIVGMPMSSDDAGIAPPEIFRNGSFLVFRRLLQDVSAFREDTDKLAARLAQDTALPTLDGHAIRELMVGRAQDGTSIMRANNLGDSRLAVNHFLYGSATPAIRLNDGEQISGAAADADGLRCPFWAHVRKVNPRDGKNDLAEDTPNLQLLRRGVPFGARYRDDETPTSPNNSGARGLLFLAYQRSIAAQFEKLNTHWMNQFQVPGGNGHDLLVGLASSENGELTERRAVLGGTEFGAPPWVRPSGGAYLFAPSRSAISRMLEQ